MVAHTTSEVVDLGMIQRDDSPAILAGPVVDPIVAVVITKGAVYKDGVVHLEDGVHARLVVERDFVAEVEALSRGPVGVVEVNGRASVSGDLPTMVSANDVIGGGGKGEEKQGEEGE